ncbi:MAG: ABC transporter ATP-binding protein [Erysipelotrichales bacterium]|nr:ABC transporter ATP-binding protein [Erysipelotrichales bacterium]
MNAIEIKHLHKKFGTHTIFEDAEFTVPEGKLTGIYGKSGSGKSTLLNIISGIEKAESGSIQVLGYTLDKHPGSVRTKLLREEIGILFQNYALIDNMTVEQNVKIAQKFSKDHSKETIAKALGKVGLEGFEKRKIYELSGGEQQRVAMARLMVKPCRLVLADEPTGNVDASNKEVIMNLFKELQNMGKTILIVTHDDSLKKYFDIAYRIDDKKIYTENERQGEELFFRVI